MCEDCLPGPGSPPGPGKLASDGIMSPAASPLRVKAWSQASGRQSD